MPEKRIRGDSDGDRIQENNAVEVLLSGFSATFVTKLALQPLDTCKTLMQVPGATGNFMMTLNDVVKTSGVRGLYRGLKASCVGAMPAQVRRTSVRPTQIGF